MTTNWRDKWQGTTRGGQVILTVEDNGDYLEVFPVDGGHYPVYPTGMHSTDRETPHDLLPITPPAEPVPQGYAEITIGGVKTLAKMDTASSLVVEHHVSGGTLMMVADDLANLRRDAERYKTALQRIAKWFGEFPDSGRTWDDHTPMSYGAAFGSNGERDFMRQVALDALNPAVDALPGPAT